jgi:proteasome lid subunit RPN8/RPN11
MLLIHRQYIKQISDMALANRSLEICGVISGVEDMTREIYPMDNQAKSNTFFEFDPVQQFRIWKKIDENGHEPLVIYHSHTQSRAYPSKDDVIYANEPYAHYLIISVDEKFKDEIRSYRIVDGGIYEENITIIN